MGKGVGVENGCCSCPRLGSIKRKGEVFQEHDGILELHTDLRGIVAHVGEHCNRPLPKTINDNGHMPAFGG